MPLPSPEPDRQAIPLDLFPTGLLANLNVLKSYSTDLPGTFGGGAMIINTDSFPTTRECKLKLSLSRQSTAPWAPPPRTRAECYCAAAR